MKVAFDARWIYDKPSGIGVYAQEMVRRLPGLLPECEFVIIFGSQKLLERHMTGASESERNVRAIVANIHPVSLKSQMSMPKVISELKADLYHSPNYMVPYMSLPLTRKTRRMKSIVNIHDVIPLVVKDYAPNSKTSRFKRVFKFCLRQSIARADVVITGSEASKRDIEKTLSVSQRTLAKVQVIPDGADVELCGVERAPIKTDSITPRTLLYVGRMDPYKNVAGLVEAFAIARHKVPFPLKLVVCGALDERYPEARVAAERLGVSDAVEFTGFVPDVELERLYSTADLLTHPSRYEGFGLQIIEAMAHGLPVICTDGGSQPEVAGEAARVVKAGDNREMASAITEILTSPQRMERMKSDGLVRAKKFSWDACALKTADVYRQVLI